MRSVELEEKKIMENNEEAPSESRASKKIKTVEATTVLEAAFNKVGIRKLDVLEDENHCYIENWPAD